MGLIVKKRFLEVFNRNMDKSLSEFRHMLEIFGVLVMMVVLDIETSFYLSYIEKLCVLRFFYEI